MSDTTDRLVDEETLQQWCNRLGNLGLRSTGSAAHAEVIRWVNDELTQLDGFSVRFDEYPIKQWAPRNGTLEAAAELRVAADGETPVVRTAGAVPYSLPTGEDAHEGELAYLPRTEGITAENSAGRIIVRDFPETLMPFAMLTAFALHTTHDFDVPGQYYSTPAFADDVLHHDLLAAGEAGAAGVIFAFDLPTEQVEGYFEPHKGTHYRLPAAFIGNPQRVEVLRRATSGATASLEVSAHAVEATTRNIVATLPGLSEERIILVTHTDGATWIQDNGVAATLALARLFAEIPRRDRPRTLEFVFATGHLHISREGSARYAEQLDTEYEAGTVTAVVCIEHLGAREVIPHTDPVTRQRRLEFSGRPDPLLWFAQEGSILADIVTETVLARDLERVAVVPGLGTPDPTMVPALASFGGIGTYFHQRLLPTTAVAGGPWSLWAPSLGADTLDICQLRKQTVAIADVVEALMSTPRHAIAAATAESRARRASGTATSMEQVPPETA